jgi:hypothetical protein
MIVLQPAFILGIIETIGEVYEDSRFGSGNFVSVTYSGGIFNRQRRRVPTNRVFTPPCAQGPSFWSHSTTSNIPCWDAYNRSALCGNAGPQQFQDMTAKLISEAARGAPIRGSFTMHPHGKVQKNTIVEVGRAHFNLHPFDRSGLFHTAITLPISFLGRLAMLSLRPFRVPIARASIEIGSAEVFIRGHSAAGFGSLVLGPVRLWLPQPGACWLLLPQLGL